MARSGRGTGEGDDLSPEEQRVKVFSDVYLHLVWSRFLPPTVLAILTPVVTEGPLTRDEISDHLRSEAVHGEGWAATAWEPLHEYTADELRELHASFAGTPLAAGDDATDDPEQVMAEEAEARARAVARVDAAAELLGVAPVRNLGDLFEFLVAARLLRAIDSGSAVRYELNPAAPLPTEIFPLPASEQAEEDEFRWRFQHEGAGQAIIRLFRPGDADRPQSIRTSLDRLARAVEMDPEKVREGVLGLLKEGDFTASVDVTRAETHQVFVLTVDWDDFARQRMVFHLGM